MEKEPFDTEVTEIRSEFTEKHSLLRDSFFTLGEFCDQKSQPKLFRSSNIVRF